MRIIENHKVGEFNSLLQIIACDDPSYANTSNVYDIQYTGFTQGIKFQTGPLYEGGVNGISNESLLAILIDRLRGYQAGPFCCDENGSALDYLELALEDLHDRTRDRIEREVEGTYQR